jgi:hypothetical protein
MNTAWTKGLKAGSQERNDVEGAYASSAFLRKRLVQILEAFEEEERNARLKAVEYESPSWALRQADSIGYARALKRVMAILTEK